MSEPTIYEEVLIGDSVVAFRPLQGGGLLPASSLLQKEREVASVGSIRTFRDGFNYKKSGDGKWVRVSQGSKGSGRSSTGKGKGFSSEGIAGNVTRSLAPSTMVDSYGESYAHVQDPKLLLEQFLSSNNAGSVALGVMQKLVLIQRLNGGEWFSMMSSGHMNKVTKRSITLAKDTNLLSKIHGLMTEHKGWEKLNKYHWICLLRTDYNLYLEKMTKYASLSKDQWEHLNKLFLIPKREDIYEHGKIRKRSSKGTSTRSTTSTTGSNEGVTGSTSSKGSSTKGATRSTSTTTATEGSEGTRAKV